MVGWHPARIVVGIVATAVVLLAVAVGWEAPGALVALALVGLAAAVELTLLARRRAELTPVPSPPPPAAEEVIRQELERSRRQQRPCTVVRVPTEVGLGLRSRLRSKDSVLQARTHVLVVLPETDRDGALTALERVAPGATGARAERPPTLACFPEDADTVQGLLLTLTTPPRRHRGAARARRDDPHARPAQHAGGLAAVTAIQPIAPSTTIRTAGRAARRWLP